MRRLRQRYGHSVRTSERRHLEQAVWLSKHKDYRIVLSSGPHRGKRAVMMLDRATGATVLAPLSTLSIEELRRLAGRS